jgi:hypothetical protein
MKPFGNWDLEADKTWWNDSYFITTFALTRTEARKNRKEILAKKTSSVRIARGCKTVLTPQLRMAMKRGPKNTTTGEGTVGMRACWTEHTFCMMNLPENHSGC